MAARRKRRSWLLVGFRVIYLLVVYSIAGVFAFCLLVVRLLAKGSSKQNTLPPKGGGFQ